MKRKEIPTEEMVVGKGDYCCYVYGLRFRKPNHPYDGMIRYVGKALDPWSRFSKHMSPTHSSGRVKRSVEKNGRECFSLEIMVKAYAHTKTDAEKTALKWEVEIISHLNTAKGKHGLNITIGGEGLSLVGEARARKRRINQRVMREIKQRPEVIEKYRELGRERFRDPEYKARMMAIINSPENIAKSKAALELRYQDEEFRTAQANRLRQITSDPEFQRRNGERTAKRNRDPAFIERNRVKQKIAHNTDEMRQRKSDIAKALHADPEFSARYQEGLKRRYADPANVASHAEHTRKRLENPAFSRSAKMGIHLHWAKKHFDNGKIEAAVDQVNKLRLLLAECTGDPQELRVMRLAEEFLNSWVDPR